MGGKSSKPKQRTLPPRHAETPPAWGQNSTLTVTDNEIQNEVITKILRIVGCSFYWPLDLQTSDR
jgi:hypothetical protein